MSLDRFKVGDRVKVMNFSVCGTPLLEGIAVCVRRIQLEPFLGLETWMVKFSDGEVVRRKIAIENKVVK
jgi:hypothetical protein